ncbi:uncharacterized protein [Periplaneta americana]|uniref:uncharacterized protein n=1 Tax=Periplaneta americana TaxID=6978 RepID=UPI0037E8ABF3
MNDEMLIEQVRQYDELYNMASKKYTDNFHKDKIWAQIGRELNTTGPACKIRWISLRDQLRKALKKKMTRSGQAAEMNRKWKYEDCMSFIIPFFKERATHNNRASPENMDEELDNEGEKAFEQNNEDVTENPTEEVENEPLIAPKLCNIIMPSNIPVPRSSHVRRASKMETASSTLMDYLIDSNRCESVATSSASSNAHPIDLFFNGLAATVKTFSPEYQHLAKSKLFAVVSELEWAQLQKQKPND